MAIKPIKEYRRLADAREESFHKISFNQFARAPPDRLRSMTFIILCYVHYISIANAFNRFLGHLFY